MAGALDEDPGGMASCRFFVIAPEKSDKSLLRISPFTIHKAIQNKIGNVVKAQRFGKEMILLEVANEIQAKKAWNLKQLTESVTVNVTPHKSLNYSKGVIFCPELNDLDVNEITQNLKLQKVVATKRITKKIKGEHINTNSYILTFVKCELPKTINVGYLRLPVRPFTPLPFRCHRCFSYNHQAKFCKVNEKCFWCGEVKHPLVLGRCDSQAKCVNCNQCHPSTSKICPEYVKEKEIKEIETHQKLSHKQARELYEKSRNHRSYASVVKGTSVDCATQTENSTTPSFTLTQEKQNDADIPTNTQTSNAQTTKINNMKPKHSEIQAPLLPKTNTTYDKKTNKQIIEQSETSKLLDDSIELKKLISTQRNKQKIAQPETSDESIELHISQNCADIIANNKPKNSMNKTNPSQQPIISNTTSPLNTGISTSVPVLKTSTQTAMSSKEIPTNKKTNRNKSISTIPSSPTPSSSTNEINQKDSKLVVMKDTTRNETQEIKPTRENYTMEH